MAEFRGPLRSCSKRRRTNREGDQRRRASSAAERKAGSSPGFARFGMTRIFEQPTPRTLMDWRQIWEICSAPDNVPIVGLIPLLGFYIYLAVKQARANDQLIEQLEGDAVLAKTHHRKTWPFRP